VTSNNDLQGKKRGTEVASPLVFKPHTTHRFFFETQKYPVIFSDYDMHIKKGKLEEAIKV